MQTRGRHRRVRGLGGQFRLLWAGQAASQLGDYVAFLTVPLFVAELSDRALDFGLVYAAETVPALVFGVFGGVLLDRSQLRPILVITDLGRAAGFGLLAIVAASPDPQIWMIVVLAFWVGLLAAAFASGLRSFLPSVLDAEHLPAGNSRLVLSEQVVFLLGPALGGIVVSTVGFSASYLLNSVTFVVSAITLMALKGVPRRELASRGRYLEDVAEGFRYLFREVRLRLVTLAGAVVNLSVAFFEAMLVLIGKRLFGLETPAELAGMFVLFGVGAIIGALFAPRFSARAGIGRTIVAGICLYAAGFFLLTVVEGTLATAAVMVLVGLGPPLVNIGVTTVRQVYTPGHLLGRVTAASRAVVWGTLPLGALIGGLLSDYFPLEVVARGLPVLLVVVAVVLFLSPVWTAHAATTTSRPAQTSPVSERENRG